MCIFIDIEGWFLHDVRTTTYSIKEQKVHFVYIMSIAQYKDKMIQI